MVWNGSVFFSEKKHEFEWAPMFDYLYSYFSANKLRLNKLSSMVFIL